MNSRKKLIFVSILVILVIFVFHDGTLFRRSAKVSDEKGMSVPLASITSSNQKDFQDTNFSLIVEPDQGITPIINVIKNAKTSVDLVMYQLEDKQIEKALVEDKDRGVSVRVLLNGGYYGAPDTPNKNAEAYVFLTSHGVSVEWTPAKFALTHEKSLVVDGRAAYIMTFNMTPQYYATSRDFAVVDSDTNDIQAIENAFDADWKNETTATQNGDDFVWSPGSEDRLISLIQNAQKTLYIYNEEMNEDAVVSTLSAAARRGVLVEVVMTDSKEWQKNFSVLSAAGVKIKTFSPKAKLYIHAKMILADDATAFVGSENFSYNSLFKNRELGIILTDRAVLTSLAQTFQKDFGG